MSSKWIEEVYEIWKNSDGFAEIEEVLVKVDDLLKKAQAGTDDDNLFSDIMLMREELASNVKSTKQGKIVSVDGRIATGVSAVIPVTDEEAERIFNEVEEQDGN